MEKEINECSPFEYRNIINENNIPPTQNWTDRIKEQLKKISIIKENIINKENISKYHH